MKNLRLIVGLALCAIFVVTACKPRQETREYTDSPLFRKK